MKSKCTPRIVSQPSYNPFPKKITPNLAYLIGLWLGDGCIYRLKKIYFCANFVSSSKDFLLFVLDLLKMETGWKTWKPQLNTSSKYKTWRFSFVSKEFYYFIKKFNSKSFLKRNKSIKLSFTRGFFDAEGSVFFTVYKPTKHKQWHISFTNTNHRLVKTILEILKQIGIVAKIYKTVPKKSGLKTIYQIRINPKKSILIFIKKVGSFHPDKSKKLMLARKELNELSSARHR